MTDFNQSSIILSTSDFLDKGMYGATKTIPNFLSLDSNLTLFTSSQASLSHKFNLNPISEALFLLAAGHNGFASATNSFLPILI